MSMFRLVAGRLAFVLCSVLALRPAGSNLSAAEPFPFDRPLVLDIKPMPPLKRVPILTVEAEGGATIDLWCKTVRGRAEFSGDAIKIEAGPLPDAMPQYMAEGQCTDQRMAADEEMLAALTQVTSWRQQGGMVILTGATAMKFRPSSN